MISFTESRPMDNMDDFDPMSMSYLGNPLPVGLLPHTDYLQPNPGMEMHDHLSNFDTETYMRLVRYRFHKRHRVNLTMSQCR